jgi:hypothetical protein
MFVTTPALANSRLAKSVGKNLIGPGDRLPAVLKEQRHADRGDERRRRGARDGRRPLDHEGHRAYRHRHEEHGR